MASPSRTMRESDGVGMNDKVEKSCWGVATWTLVAVGGGVALLYLFGVDLSPAIAR